MTYPMQNSWYTLTRQYTTQLVRIRSVSPDEGELQVAEEVLRLLQADGLENAYTAIGLDPLPGDPSGRKNAYAFLRGRSLRTVVLLGHIDTVNTADYGALEPWALDPAGLAARQDELAALAPGLVEDLADHPGDWMFGRGSIDMKSGVAANIVVMRSLAEMAQEGQLSLSVVLLATPDEENQSPGVLQAVHFLLRLRARYGLDYLGAINTDYTTSRYPDDPHRYIYVGTIGKLLPSFLVIGQASHVGDPFDGLDANLLAAEIIRDLSMNDELCDVVRGQSTPPPVTLKASDLKTGYDVQLPFAAYFYLNVLTFSSGPGELLARLRLRTETVLEEALQRIDNAERRWVGARGDAGRVEQLKPRSGTVLTYAELYAEVRQQLGQERMETELRDTWDSMTEGLDARERCLRLVRHLQTLSGKQGPSVVIYYSPPYYPHVAATPCLLHEVVADVAVAHTELNLEVQEYYPFISDMSYLRLDPGMEDLEALTANIPIWQEPTAPDTPGTYSLPLKAIGELSLPVVNLGPYGKDAHQCGERVLMSYSFGTLPQLLYEVIESLAQRVETGSS